MIEVDSRKKAPPGRCSVRPRFGLTVFPASSRSGETRSDIVPEGLPQTHMNKTWHHLPQEQQMSSYGKRYYRLPDTWGTSLLPFLPPFS